MYVNCRCIPKCEHYISPTRVGVLSFQLRENRHANRLKMMRRNFNVRTQFTAYAEMLVGLGYATCGDRKNHTNLKS